MLKQELNDTKNITGQYLYVTKVVLKGEIYSLNKYYIRIKEEKKS